MGDSWWTFDVAAQGEKPPFRYVTNDPCQAAAFLWANGLTEQAPGLFKSVASQCQPPSGAAPSPPAPAQSTSVPPGSSDADGPPSAPDDPYQEGAPTTETTTVLSAEHSPDAVDPQTPTNDVYAPDHPTPPAVAVDALHPDATPEEAETWVDFLLQNRPMPGERDPSRSGETTCFPLTAGDPVDLFRGLLAISTVDLDVPTPLLPLRLVRRYESGRPYFGPWGYGWDHNYNVYLRELADGGVARWTGELHEDYFHWTGDTFEPERGVHDRLERLQDDPQSYLVTRPGGVTLRFERPSGWTDAERIPLVAIRDRHGSFQTLTYDALNRVERVADEAGRALLFLYGTCGLLEGLEDHTGRHVDYDHHAEIEHLARVVMPPTAVYPHGVSTCYEYDFLNAHPALRHNLLRVIDADDNTYLENVYGDDPSSGWTFNRVIAQRYGDYLYDYAYEQIQYVPEDAAFVSVASVQTAVRTPDGALHVYTFNYRGDLLDHRFRLNLDGSYRVVAAQWEYDAQGNVTAEVHPDASRTVFTYDTDNANPCARGTLLKVERFAGPAFVATSRILQQTSYDPVYQLPIETIAEHGSRTRFIYDFDVAPGPAATGKLVRIDWPAVTLLDGSLQQAVTQVEMNQRGKVTAVVSPEGRRREVRYLEDGTPFAQFVKEAEADVGGLGIVTRYEYAVRPGAQGYLRRWIDGAGHVTEYLTDARGDLEEIRLPAVEGVVDSVRYRHDANGQLRAIEHPRGDYTDAVISDPWIRDDFSTDPIGHLVKAVLGANTAQPRPHRVCPDFEGRAVKETDAAGVVTRRHFDERGLLLCEVEAWGTPAQLETHYVYDRAGHMLPRTDPGGRSTHIAYDPWGRVATTTLPSGTIIHTEWGPGDLLLARTVEGDPGDGGPPRVLARTTYAFDERDRLLRTTQLSFTTDASTAIELPLVHWYDRDNLLVKCEGVRGAVWSNAYDGLGRRTRVQDPMGNAVETQYGPTDLPESMTSEDVEGAAVRKRTTLFDYDPRGRLRQRISAAGVARLRCDARDLPVETVNALGIVTQRAFGLLGEVTRQTVDVGGLNLVSEQAYDLLARPTAYRDPTLEQTVVERDPLGRVTALTLPDQTVWTSAYNAAGDLMSIAAPGGSTLTFAYDPAGRLQLLASHAGPGRIAVPTHSYGYDGLDRIVRAAAESTAITRAFDGVGRLIREQTGTHTFARAYDDLTGTATLVYPDGHTEAHDCDLLGRVQQITLVQPGTSPVGMGSGTPGSVLLEVAYAGPAQVLELRHGNGVVTVWHYDDEGRAIRVEQRDAAGMLLESARYRHDAASRRRVTQLLGSPEQALVQTFDAHDRLIQARGGFPLPALADADTQANQDADIAATEGSAGGGATDAETYALDGADTRLSTTTITEGVTSAATYTSLPGHRVVAAGGQALSYDADGQRTSDGTHLFTYDALGRCVAVQDAATQALLAQLSYDPLGRLAAGDYGAGPFHRFYFGPSWLQEETGASLVKRQRTIHPSLALPIVESSAQGSHHLHVDGHLNLVLATDTNGVPVARFRYAPFGVPTTLNGSGTGVPSASGAALQPVFGGMSYWEKAHLYATPHRLYDPHLGLFLGRDPDGYRTSPSSYVFGRHDPVDLADPGGDVPVWLVPGLVVGAITAAATVFAVYRANPDASVGDYFALGGIGFAAGFISGATFGLASSTIEAQLAAWGVSAYRVGTVGTAIWRASEVAVPIAVPAISEALGGAFTSAGAGAISGYGSGLYQAYRFGGPDVDPWAVAKQEAKQEGVAGFVSGFVGGGMLGGLRVVAALPPGTYAAFKRGVPMSAGLWARGLAGPYGFGGFAIGYTSSLSGTLARQVVSREAVDPFGTAAQRDALIGGGLSLAMPWLVPHPYTAGGESGWGPPVARLYWRYRLRLDPREFVGLEALHRSFRGQHHVLSWAPYPEHALDPFNLRAFAAEAQHQAWHDQWGVVPGRHYSQTQTHGPYVPSWPGSFGFHLPKVKP